MGLLVCSGAQAMCSFGMAPSVLNALPTPRVLCATPALTIADIAPGVNIAPFGMCSSILNPVVAAATAAKLGVLTPMPCVPSVAAPWAPGCTDVLIGGIPALESGSTAICMWAGIIKIIHPGQQSIIAG